MLYKYNKLIFLYIIAKKKEILDNVIQICTLYASKEQKM